MAFYESVFIIRQDVSTADVDKIVDDFTKIAKEHNSKIVKNEYWGLRPLAYEINNNKKGHYIFLGIDGNHEALQEIDRRVKLSEDVIRSLVTKVDAIEKEPSAILRSKNPENEEIVNVTVNKDLN